MDVRWHRPEDLRWMADAAVVAAWENLDSGEVLVCSAPVLAMTVRQALQHFLQTPGALAVVATEEGRPIGFLLGAPGPDASTGEVLGHILMGFVDPFHRRRGVMRAMYGLVEDAFRTMGLRKVKMWSGLHNRAAIEAGLAFGYRPEGLIGRAPVPPRAD